MRLDQAALPLAAAVAVTAVSVVGTDLARFHAASAEADRRAQAVGHAAPPALTEVPTDGSAAPVRAATLTRKAVERVPDAAVRRESPVSVPPAPTYLLRSPAVRSTTAAPADPAPLPLMSSPPPPSPPPSPSPDGDGQTVRLAHANIKIGTSTFASDLATVSAGSPDFITLNEAAFRSDVQIRPPGYHSYRSMEHVYTRETPVLWRADRWDMVDTGTRWLTRRKVKWGERAVNWVTLRSLQTGRTVSVVSAHPAPTTRATAGLLPVFTEGLTRVVGELRAHGPVLVGGDLNAHYTSALYPRALLAAGDLTATYDTFGMPPGGTGDHRGGTIDYLLHTTGLRPTAQSKAELASDHDALFGTFELSATS